jgi:hypothetical protein
MPLLPAPEVFILGIIGFEPDVGVLRVEYAI